MLYMVGPGSGILILSALFFIGFVIWAVFALVKKANSDKRQRLHNIEKKLDTLIDIENTKNVK